jgi:hypothetical protein
MQEICKPLSESSWYDVSNRGRVRSWRSRKHGERRPIPTILKVHDGRWGVAVALRLIDGDRRTMQRAVSCLVAEAFISARPAGMVCRHLNDDRRDNRVENLAWGTVADNSADAKRNGKAPAGIRHGCAKLTLEQVLRIRSVTKRGEARRLAQEFCVSESLLSMIRHGRVRKEVA